MTQTMLPAVPERIDRLCAELVNLSTEELLDTLLREVEVTADRILRIAAIIRTLDNRGADTSHLRLGMMDYFRRVARGELLPELIATYQQRPLLIEKAGALPLARQAEMAAGEKLTVIVPKGDKFATEQLTLDQLTGRQLHQIFLRGQVRSEREQIRWLEQSAAKVPVKRRGPKAVAKVDRERGGIVFKGSFLSKADLERLLDELK